MNTDSPSEPTAERHITDNQPAEAAAAAMAGGEMPSSDRSASGDRASDPPTHRWREIGRTVAALGLGLGIALTLRAVGWTADTRDNLEAMGFDPDRAQLLTSLTAGAIAGAAAVLIFGTRVTGVLIATIGIAVLFGPTLITETRSALELRGLDGSFDPLGWGLTVLALVAAAVVIGWVAATLASAVRTRVSAAIRSVEMAARQRTIRGIGVSGLVADLVVVVVLLVTVPILGDILDYGPPTHMASGAGQPIAPPVASQAPAASLATTPAPDALQPPQIELSPDAVAGGTPWAGTRPTGVGRMETLQLPAPWTDGVRTTIDISVYLPPGYDATTRRYPVLYEVPWSPKPWQTGMSYSALMDTAIQSGTLPPEITVFVAQSGGPYPTSECADSFDARERFDTFVASTLVAHVDSLYRTIRTIAARSLFGFSQGGFCAANLLLRHPDVFGQAVSFSGYFVAGLASAQTPNSWRPWGHQPAFLAANSPISEAGGLSVSERSRLFFVLVGSQTEPPYGPQLQSFAQVLSNVGIAHAVLTDSIGHSWQEVRADLRAAFSVLAARQALLGVFSTEG